MPTYATPGPVAATVEVAGARVRVTASDRTDTTVLVEPINAANRKDVKVAEKTKVDFAGGQLSVKTTAPGDKAGSVAITINVPVGSGLTAYMAHSDVHADGSFGECELHVASGRVRLDRINALRASIASGAVAIGRIAGRADIDGTTFAMRIDQAEGEVRLENSGGQAWIGHAAADLTLGSAGCDFDIDRADGNVIATTAGGAIRIGRLTQGHAELMNGSGNIEVGIGEGIAAHIDVNSEKGAVRDTVSSRGSLDLSNPRVSVHARTRYGDIIVRPAAGGLHKASAASTS